MMGRRKQNTLSLLFTTSVLAMGCAAKVQALSTEPGTEKHVDKTDGANPGTGPTGGSPDAGITAALPGSVGPYTAPTSVGNSEKCDWQPELFPTLAMPCQNVCLAEYGKGKAPRVLADDGSLAYGFNVVLASTEAHVLVQATEKSSLDRLVLALPLDGGTPIEMYRWTDTAASVSLVDVHRWNDSLSIVVSRRTTPSTVSVTVWLIPANAPSALAGKAPIATFSTGDFPSIKLDGRGLVLLSRAGDAAATTNVDVVSLVDGSAERLLSQPNVVDVSLRSPSAFYFLEGNATQQPSGGALGTRLMRHDLATKTTSHLLTVEAAGRVFVDDDPGVNRLFVMGAQNVYSVELGDGTNQPREIFPAEVLYRGNEFPQHSGTFDPRYLAVDLPGSSNRVAGKSRVYFAEICHADADDPGYGLRAYDLDARKITWMDAESGFPWMEEVFRYGRTRTYERVGLPRNSRGVYALAH